MEMLMQSEIRNVDVNGAMGTRDGAMEELRRVCREYNLDLFHEQHLTIKDGVILDNENRSVIICNSATVTDIKNAIDYIKLNL